MATKREELRDALNDDLWDDEGLRDATEQASGKRDAGGCLAKAHPDEPLFILRAQDSFSPDTVRAWVGFCIAAGMEWDNPKATEALAWCDQAEAWQAEHGSKVPD